MWLSQIVGRRRGTVTETKRPLSGIEDKSRCGTVLEPGQSDLRATLLAASVYAILVLFMWGPVGPTNGMPYETSFPYMSETSSWVEGFFYRADPLRTHTNFFYHVSYLLGYVLGIKGSFLPYQLVYATLWWARGALVFLILMRLLPSYVFFNYLVGALVLVHAADGALQWVGQLNQFGYIFWMLLSFYCFVIGYQNPKWFPALAASGLSILFLYMSLWSYESQLFLLAISPWIVVLGRRRLSWRFLSMTASWYGIIAYYVFLTVSRYLKSAGQTYQESVLRADWSAQAIFGDWLFNVKDSMNFWAWQDQAFAWDYLLSQSTLGFQRAHYLGIALAASVVFVIGGILLYVDRKGQPRWNERVIPHGREWLAAFVVGLLLLSFSFPVYLLLSSARTLWRTQFLSGIGTGLCLATLLVLIVRPLPRTSLRVVACLLAGALIVYCGVNTALKRSVFHQTIWERHRVAMAQVIRAAPRVEPDTLIVLVNVPKNPDPFGHNMWFDMAIRLAYPFTPVAGIYYLDDGSLSPGGNLKLLKGKWEWDKTGYPPNIRSVSASHTIVVAYSPEGTASIVEHIPQSVGADATVTEMYQPYARIRNGPPVAQARHRYLQGVGLRNN